MVSTNIDRQRADILATVYKAQVQTKSNEDHAISCTNEEAKDEVKVSISICGCIQSINEAMHGPYV